VAKASAKKSETKVTRIKASDSEVDKAEGTPTKPIAIKAKKDKKVKVLEVKTSDTTVKQSRANVFVRIGRYFKGAWTELRLVRWPDRKATWGMTGALLIFTTFFIVIIVILDYGFSQLFNLILGSS